MKARKEVILSGFFVKLPARDDVGQKRMIFLKLLYNLKNRTGFAFTFGFSLC